MNYPTVPVTAVILDENSQPVAGAIVTASLTGDDLYQGETVQGTTSAVTDASGTAVLDLFPNTLGERGTRYAVAVIPPASAPGTIVAAHYLATVPDMAVNLMDIASHAVSREHQPKFLAHAAALAAEVAASVADLTEQSGQTVHGLPAGGSAGQVLSKIDGTDYNVGFETLTPTLVGLGSVTNDAQVKRSEMGAASGVATLDASSHVVQDPASKGQADGVASLDSNSRVAQLPSALSTDAALGGASASDTAIPSQKAVKTYADGLIGGIVQTSQLVNALGNVNETGTIDLTAGGVVTATSTGATTWTFANPAASGICSTFSLVLTNGGAYPQTWPSSVNWPSGEAPVLTSSGVDVLTFFTVDGGAIWRGEMTQKNSKSGISATGELDTLLGLTSSGDLVVSSNMSLENTTDSFYRARFNNLTVNAGCLLTLANRGMMSILIDGDLTVDGTISMSQRGAVGTGANVVYTVNGSATQTIAYATGAAGGVGYHKPDGSAYASAGANGSAGTAGKSGGGGCGGMNDPFGNERYFGSGGTGTSYSGGPGTGGNSLSSASNTGGAGTSYQGIEQYEGGGAGNPGGSGHNGASAGGTGTGGLLILFCLGNVTIASGAALTSAGADGGSANAPGASGGGSGGGVIYLAHGGSFSNSGTISAPGGAGGSYYYSGGNGGAGNCRVVNLNTLVTEYTF